MFFQELNQLVNSVANGYELPFASLLLSLGLKIIAFIFFSLSSDELYKRSLQEIMPLRSKDTTSLLRCFVCPLVLSRLTLFFQSFLC